LELLNCNVPIMQEALPRWTATASRRRYYYYSDILSALLHTYIIVYWYIDRYILHIGCFYMILRLHIVQIGSDEVLEVMAFASRRLKDTLWSPWPWPWSWPWGLWPWLYITADWTDWLVRSDESTPQRVISQAQSDGYSLDEPDSTGVYIPGRHIVMEERDWVKDKSTL